MRDLSTYSIRIGYKTVSLFSNAQALEASSMIVFIISLTVFIDPFYSPFKRR